MSETKMSKEPGAGRLASEVVKWYILNEEMRCLSGQGAQVSGDADLLGLAGNLSTELGKIGKECGAMLQKLDLSDIVLLLGAGGVLTYLWKSSTQESRYASHPSSLADSNLMSWLFDEPVLRDESARIRRPTEHLIYNSYSDEESLRRSGKGSNSSGLNALSSSQGSRRFLKHRLFDIGQLRDTSRFKSEETSDLSSENLERDEETSFAQKVSNFNSEKSKFLKSRYLPTARLYGDMKRGTPDGQERSVSPPEVAEQEDDDEKVMVHRAAVNPRVFPRSDSMMEIMRSAKEVRRLIRETSLDSEASDLCLEIPCKEGSMMGEEGLEFCQEGREDSFTPLDLNTTDYRDLFKLVGFSDRESSIFSDFSDDWRDERRHKLALGLSSAASEVGEDGDQWEWEDDCYYQEDTQQIDYDAWLPQSKQLDWEKTLETKESGIYSDKTASSESVTKDNHFRCRLPPSGRSSIQSLDERVRTEDEELKSHVLNST